jgi:hypothetical protein
MSRIIRIPKRWFFVIVSTIVSVVLRLTSFAFGSVSEPNRRSEAGGYSGKQFTLLLKAPKPRLRGLFRRNAPGEAAKYYRIQLASSRPFLRFSLFEPPSLNLKRNGDFLTAAYVAPPMSLNAIQSCSSPPPPPPPPVFSPPPGSSGGGGSPPPSSFDLF